MQRNRMRWLLGIDGIISKENKLPFDKWAHFKGKHTNRLVCSDKSSEQMPFAKHPALPFIHLFLNLLHIFLCVCHEYYSAIWERVKSTTGQDGRERERERKKTQQARGVAGVSSVKWDRKVRVIFCVYFHLLLPLDMHFTGLRVHTGEFTQQICHTHTQQTLAISTVHGTPYSYIIRAVSCSFGLIFTVGVFYLLL